MSMFYKLDDDKRVVPCEMMEHVDFMMRGDHVLWQEERSHEMVSTCFLGLNGGFNRGDGIPAHMFETMHFPGNESRRCSTYEEAKEQHGEMVAEFFEEVT